ncbi:MAG: hypothetical protein ABSH49_12060 [Bryobacteraceae bacterium]|jgi:uncharacterized protein (TIGR03437 family)
MKPKRLYIFCAFFCSAIAGYPQSTTNSVTLNSAPSAAVGQPAGTAVTQPESASPNLVEGRELFNPENVALDTSVTPPIIYVSDSNNNRVLAWKNATGFATGQAADLIIGQPDQYSTNAGGPGTGNSPGSSGLYFPTGLAVYQGNLYVADTNNNRIIRFPHPFAQSGLPVQPDLVIGQPSVNAKTANYTGQVSAQGVYFSVGVPVSLAFDSNGNLWTTDPGNRRVLEFPQSAIAAGGNAIAATVEFGQPNLTSTYPTAIGAGTTNGQTITNQFAVPLALGFDGSGNLFVSDSDPSNAGTFSRVLVFVPTGGVFGTAASAARIMGVVQTSQLTGLTQSAAQTIVDQTSIAYAQGLFFLADSSVGVVDSAHNRILIFPPYAKWPAPTASFSPEASLVVGQTGFAAFGPNGNSSSTVLTPPASSGSLYSPAGAVYNSASQQLFVADTANNRVLVFPLVSGATFQNATAALGQASLVGSSVNLIEGKEFDFLSFGSSGATADAGIALDTSGSVPHLYVADTYNNRVLGFYDARKIAPGAFATIVIGQKDFTTGLCNYPTGDTAVPTQNSLCQPTDVLVDSAGNLYVADRGNGRVLRFPAPFANCPTPSNCTLATLEQADLVLGQASFTFSNNQAASQSTMGAPYGLAFTGVNGLMVSDELFNRVLYIPFSANGTFAAGADNGKAATKVFGQQNFTSTAAGNGVTQLNSPHHIAADTNGQVYVADTGNNRVPIFPDPHTSTTTEANPILTLTGNGISTPVGLFVNASTGEIWVANGGTNTCIRFPKYETLELNPVSNGFVYASQITLAVLQDQYGDLFVADGTNRISVYYQGLTAINGASFLAYKNIAPGMIASIFPAASSTQFGVSSLNAGATSLPLSTTLGNLQVLFNGAPAPMYFAGSGQINFQVPNSAPSSGTATLEVVDATTGQVYGAGTVTMSPQSPGIFQCGPLTAGPGYDTVQACVINDQDGTVNSTSNPAKRGSIISIYGTGQGYIPNAPPDGTPATGASDTVAAGSTRVWIGPGYVDEVTAGNPTCSLQPGDPQNGQWITYSGLAPGEPGVWQINVQIPMCVAPATATLLFVVQNSVTDTDSHSAFGNTNTLFHMSIAVK